MSFTAALIFNEINKPFTGLDEEAPIEIQATSICHTYLSCADHSSQD